MLHFPIHEHKHVQAVLKFQSPYFDCATDPILHIFQHTSRRLYFANTWEHSFCSHMAISIHEHNHITTQTPQVYVSVRTHLMSSLSFLFSLPLFLTMSLTIIFAGRKQPCILHLLLFPDEAAALSLSSLSPSSTSAHLRSFYFVPHPSSAVRQCLSSSLFPR